MERPVICVTGHRPNKLYGYNLIDKRYLELKELFKKFLKEQNCKEAITGMALGVDTIFALAVIELKEEGFDISLHCAVPCFNHTSAWFNKEDIKRYNDILEKADIKKIVTEAPYAPYVMQKRNEYMVNNADMVLSVHDGSKGGTYNCVLYAKKKEKSIYNISPNEFPLEIKKQ